MEPSQKSPRPGFWLRHNARQFWSRRVSLHPNGSVFAESLFSVMGSMATLFLISLIGFLAVRRNVVNDVTITGLAHLLVDVIVPAKMATALMAGLNNETLTKASVVMLVMIVMNIGMLLLAGAVTWLWRGGTGQQNRAIATLSAFQNGIYVPLPLILALLPPALETEGTILVSGAVTVMILTQWSIAIYTLRGEQHGPREGASLRDTIRGTLNPPIISILVGAGLSLLPAAAAAARGESAPAFIAIPVKAADLIGDSLAPIAMILLGMLIGQCHLRGVLRLRTISIPVALRLFVAPLLMLAALWSDLLGWISPLVALVLIIQASAPPATNLSLIARRYEGDWQLVSAVLLVTYLVALFTMPVFTALVMARQPLF